MLSSARIAEKIRFLLDAEGVDHYGDVEDIIPSINMGIDWITSVMSRALAQKKFSPEILREVHKSVIVRLSAQSRFALSVVSDNLWTITSVIVNPQVLQSSAVVLTPDDNRSYRLSNQVYISGGKHTDRKTLEEWAVDINNPFASGYNGDQICEDLKTYCYLDPTKFLTSVDVPQQDSECQVRPPLPKGKVAVFYVDKVAHIEQLDDDDIALPASVSDLLINKACQYISYKQGDRTTLYSVTSQDISQLTAVLI